MNGYSKHPMLNNDMLPVDIVLHSSWWYHNTGLTFDEDFFFHPKKRVEAERQMERTLYERWGQYGLGQDHATDRPHISAPIFLHSECSHTMISVKDYERYHLPYDIEWSRAHRPSGKHIVPDPRN